MRLLALLSVSMLVSGCLRTWDLGGPWKCGDDQVCPGDFTCDDGVCCKPGGSPACPTLPLPGGGCPDGEPNDLYRDEDGDGEGNPRVSRPFCRAPVAGGWVTLGTDCDDVDPAINSTAHELCNGKDDNCNGVIDDGLAQQQDFYLDEDGDEYGNDAEYVSACVAPPGYVTQGRDCQPFDPSKHPDAPELCNNLDDNCDGVSDTAATGFVDTDGPGESAFPCVANPNAGRCEQGVFRCAVVDAGVVRSCTALNTPLPEVCDGVDNDCDGTIDERPSCGGPSSLFDAGLTFRAAKVNGGTLDDLYSRCQIGRSILAVSVSPDGKTWSSDSNGAGYYVWSAQAPAGQGWDMGKLNAGLRIALNVAAAAGGATTGAWGTRDAGSARNPVIYLCGDDPFQFARYVPLDAAQTLEFNETSLSMQVLLNNSDPALWTVGNGSGFGTANVRSIEVFVQSFSPNFTMTFSDAPGQGGTGFTP